MSTKKTRPDSKLKTLPEDRQAEICDYAREHTLAETQAWLAEDGIRIGITPLQRYLAEQRERAAQERILTSIASGAQLVRDAEQTYRKNPAPTNDQLIKLFRVLVMQLAATGSCDAEFLKIAGPMMGTVLEAERVALKREELSLAREKFQRETCELFVQWSADQRARAVADDASTTQAQKIERLGQMMFGENWK